MKLSDQLRQAINDCGVSRYRIARESGVDESNIAKFFNGSHGLSLDSIDKLGCYLGLRLVSEGIADE